MEYSRVNRPAGTTALYVCICNGVTDRQIREAAASGVRSVAELTMRTGCGATCGSCLEMAVGILDAHSTERRSVFSLPLLGTGISQAA
jgi:bacterioferritin-associated ferredoxin